MKPFVVLAVLGAFVLSAQAFSKCDDELIKKIKKNLKESPLDLKVLSLKENGDGIIAAHTFSYFPPGINCAASKLDIDDTYTVTTVDITGKLKKEPKIQLESDDKMNEYYTKTPEGVKVYSVPYYSKDGVLACYTCADQEPKKGLEDHIPDAFVKIWVDTTKKDAEKIIESKKKAVEEAKKVGCKEYKFNFEPEFLKPEECLKKINECEKKKQ